MNLSEYIELIGAEAAANLFGLKPRVIESYRRRERSPRDERAKEMIRLAGGKLDWAGIRNQHNKTD